MQDTLGVLIPVAVTHVVALGLMIFVIKRLLLGDTRRAVARIREVEAEVRRKEERIRAEIAEHERDYEQKRAEAEVAIERQRQESEKELAKMRDKVVADSRKEGERIIDQAKKNEEKLRRQIAQDMEEKAVDYGGQIFRLVFSEEMNSALNGKFIDELLDALDEVDSSSITVDAGEAEFRSSHPIEDSRRKRLETLLKTKFGADISVKEKLDENLLAGLAFKLGSLEIDGSLLSRYHEAVAEVKKSVNV
jgi:F0F1-type ATP synthase membrane subunit b/b'